MAKRYITNNNNNKFATSNGPSVYWLRRPPCGIYDGETGNSGRSMTSIRWLDMAINMPRPSRNWNRSSALGEGDGKGHVRRLGLAELCHSPSLRGPAGRPLSFSWGYAPDRRPRCAPGRLYTPHFERSEPGGLGGTPRKRDTGPPSRRVAAQAAAKFSGPGATCNDSLALPWEDTLRGREPEP